MNAFIELVKFRFIIVGIILLSCIIVGLLIKKSRSLKLIKFWFILLSAFLCIVWVFAVIYELSHFHLIMR